MNITAIRPHELTDDQIGTWTSLLTTQPGLDSPFFHPTYVRRLGEFRKNVEVAILSDKGHPVGFIPFERHGQTTARPIGVKLCDLQGFIGTPGLQWSMAEVLRGCGLKVWHFDHQLANQANLQPWHYANCESPYMDLSTGFDQYISERKQSGTALIAQTERKSRKLQREIGSLRFEWHSNELSVLDKLLEWKQDQRRRTKTFDILQFDWVKSFLEKIWTTHTYDFTGVLSALYADDRLIAAHLGMRTPSVLHYWFASYDREFSKYSPGLSLLLRTAQEATSRGVQRLDLGKGSEKFKPRFASASLPIAEGAVELRPAHAALRATWSRASHWIKSSTLYGPVQLPKRWIRQIHNLQIMD
jgi:CelD/BcsL family acetyltransferase involved in cellulose biosynthesis